MALDRNYDRCRLIRGDFLPLFYWNVVTTTVREHKARLHIREKPDSFQKHIHLSAKVLAPPLRIIQKRTKTKQSSSLLDKGVVGANTFAPKCINTKTFPKEYVDIIPVSTSFHFASDY